MLQVPNIPLEHVPVAPDESGNVVVAEHGAKRDFDFTPRPHWELAESLGLIDFERGVKVAGSDSTSYAATARGCNGRLITWMLDLHTRPARLPGGLSARFSYWRRH